jgi:hypothetical protein
MESLRKNFDHIKGWGVDIDPDNEPTYPMKNWTGADHQRLEYQRPTLQQSDTEVLHSNERPGLTAVFGTPQPPKGLSGAVRRLSFRYSEGKWWHWLGLILADRINMVEGIVDDIRGGKLPNIPAERGFPAEWKYNKGGFIKKVAITTAIAIGAVWLLRQKQARSGSRSGRQA